MSHLSQNDVPKNAFSSFDILNNHQSAVIQAQLTEEETNLQELRRAIEDAEQHVLYLKDLAINSAFRVFELRSPSAPWRKLPNELLSFIFLLVKNAGKKNPRTGRHPVPWRIAHVCRRWRSVACGTPSLWIDIPFFSQTGHNLFSNIAATIHLSNPLPVRIFLAVDDPETKPYLHPIYKFVNAIPTRIGALKLSLDRLSHFGSLSALNADLTALESLTFHFNAFRALHNPPVPQYSPTAIAALQNATALRKIRISYGRVTSTLALQVIDNIVTAIPPVTASRVDTLVVALVTVSTLSTLFNHFSSLSQCAFLLFPSDGSIPAISHKSVQRLNRVKLCGSSWHGPAEFQLHHFLDLLAPRLSHLTLWQFRVTSLPSSWNSHDQSAVLRYLDLRRSQVPSDLLLQTLESLPNLVYFYCTSSSDFLVALSQKMSSGEPQLPPRLSVFYMDMQTTIRQNVLHICTLARWLAILPDFSEMHIQYQEREDLFHLFDGPYANVHEMMKHRSMEQILKACQPLPDSAESALDSVSSLFSQFKPWLTTFAGFGKHSLRLQHNPRTLPRSSSEVLSSMATFSSAPRSAR